MQYFSHYADFKSITLCCVCIWYLVKTIILLLPPVKPNFSFWFNLFFMFNLGDNMSISTYFNLFVLFRDVWNTYLDKGFIFWNTYPSLILILKVYIFYCRNLWTYVASVLRIPAVDLYSVYKKARNSKRKWQYFINRQLNRFFICFWSVSTWQ